VNDIQDFHDSIAYSVNDAVWDNDQLAGPDLASDSPHLGIPNQRVYPGNDAPDHRTCRVRMISRDVVADCLQIV
jgi:hypothetical protein